MVPRFSACAGRPPVPSRVRLTAVRGLAIPSGVKPSVPDAESRDAPYRPAAPQVAVVGIGEAGWDALTPAARDALEGADLIIGGARHLDFLPDALRERSRLFPSPLGPFLDRLAGALRDGEARSFDGAKRIAFLASGSPMLYGIGSSLAERGLEGRFTVHPALSTLALACAQLGWAESETVLVSACGRPLDALSAELVDGGRVVVLSADETTPARAAALLRVRGFGASRIHVLEHLGGPLERVHAHTAAAWPEGWACARLNALAIALVADADTPPLARFGLPDDAFEHDGQITKRDVRLSALARLAPQPGALLWDIGTGAGSVGIEWCLAAPRTRAIGVERDPMRAERARSNAARLGAVGYRVIEAEMPGGLETLLRAAPSRPDAIFVGGGASVPGLLERLWSVLGPGGRLVAHGVTLETERVLLEAQAAHGGELTRLQVSHASPVGRFTAMRPAMAVLQWSHVRRREGAATSPDRPPEG